VSDLFVSDSFGDTIYRIDSDGGIGSFSSGGGSGDPFGPFGLAFDRNGILYCSNFARNTISKITPSGAISSFVSSGLSGPEGLAFDSSGNLYAANFMGNSISKITPSGAVSTFASGGGLNGPVGLVFDGFGNLYAANYFGNTISKISSGGEIDVFVGAGLNNPEGLAFDHTGNLYVVNNPEPDPNFISKVTPDGTLSTLVFDSGLSAPVGIAFNSRNNNLYVTNCVGNFISEVTLTGDIRTFATFGGDGFTGIAIYSVPEPSSLFLGGSWMLGLLVYHSRQRVRRRPETRGLSPAIPLQKSPIITRQSSIHPSRSLLVSGCLKVAKNAGTIPGCLVIRDGVCPMVLCPNGAQGDSPGQSEAPPWDSVRIKSR
jgi:DNA-binding beta-propeller fold protein YncE